MTPQQKGFLFDLIHAAFERARSQGIRSPIDLASFGKLLRELDPGFSHQAYGHERLLYLLRGEFYDLLYIRKDAEASPPRYYVDLRQQPRAVHRTQSDYHGQAQVPGVIDSSLVDGALLERYLVTLAESSARTQRRFESIEHHLVGVHAELEKSRANEVRLHAQVSELETTCKDIVHRTLTGIKKELEQSRANEVRMNAEMGWMAAALKDLKRRW